MTNFLIFHLFEKNNFLISIGLSIALYLLILNQWPRLMKKISSIKNYSGVQRVHEGEVPRLGGFVIFAGLFFYWLFSDNKENMSFINSFLLACIPLFLISLKEDLFYSTSPTSRLICMLFSSILFFILYDISFPIIEFPFLGQLLNNYFGMSLLFFSLCVLVVINGSNLIDGSNGLLSMTVIMQILCLMYICHINSDLINMSRLLIFFTLLLIFLLFNYPFGRVFLGDSGAYILGFATSLLTIIIFSEHSNIPTWLAALILFYPVTELIFSIIRKLLQNKNPMMPDSSHLHLKLFYLLNNNIISKKTANSLVMPCLCLIWGMPFIILVWVMDSLLFTLIGVGLSIVIYLCFYWVIPEKKN